MPFQKGHPKWGGREKGTANKSYLSLRYWFEVVADNAANLGSEKKIEIAFRAINVLAPKVQNLPTEPGDSVDNAIRTQVLLQSFETKSEPVDPQPNAPIDPHS